MLRNGLYFVADAAARGAGDPLIERHRVCLILGSLREDVLGLPAGRFTEYPSFRHFGGRGLPGGYLPLLWPGPRWTAAGLYRKALRLGRAGALPGAFVQVGRILHVLTDMCIPSHVHRVAHQRDPFEWWIEGNLPELRALPIPEVPDVERAAQLIGSLARSAAAHRPDATSTPLGRVLRRAGLVRPVTAREAREQALSLVPLAVGHARALLRLFARDLRRSGLAGRDAVLLDQPVEGVAAR